MTATPKLCFVIMPFSEERRVIYDKAIKPACDLAGFAALRVDEVEGVYNINQKIIEHIFESAAIIADLTDWRPNVFYEMGVAHAIDNKTVMIIQEKDDVPFDVHSYSCIKYVQDEKGLDKLAKRLTSALKTLEQWRKHPANPVQQFKPRNAFALAHEMEELRRQLHEAERQLREKEALLKSMIAPSQWQKLQAEHQRAQNELKAKEQAAAQHAAELIALQKEVERLRAFVPAPKPVQSSKPALKLRVEPKDKLAEEEVKRMLAEKNFYDRDWHSSGKGIAHQYEKVERNGEKLVVDHATGLTWQQAGSADARTYEQAELYVRDLNKNRFAGYDDWRLPTLEEGMSLMESTKKNGDLYIAPEFDKTQGWIWTADKPGPGRAWVVSFYTGYCARVDVGFNFHVRAVR
jgi:hypothetical protein